MGSQCKVYFIFYNFFKRCYLFLERGKEGGREWEKHQCVVASCTASTGDLARNPGMCPDWESNQRPLGSQASTQSTQPHQPGHKVYLFTSWVKGVKGLGSKDWQEQNSHGDVKYSIGNIVNNTVITRYGARGLLDLLRGSLYKLCKCLTTMLNTWN